MRLVLATTGEAAEREAQSFVNAARHIIPSIKVRTGPYWKQPECWEVFLDALLEDDGSKQLDGLMNLIGLGWTISGGHEERSAVWSGKGTPLAPSLEWANIELFQAPALRS